MMNKPFSNARTWLALAAVLLSGCVAQTTINSKAFAPPRSVVIMDIPKVNVVAVVGVIVPSAPGFPGFHFSEKADYYYLAGTPQGPTLPDHMKAMGEMAQQQVFNSQTPMRPATAGAAAGAGVIVGAIIQSSADETFKKSQSFGADILKRFPDYDLREDFMKSLRGALESRGMAVALAPEGKDSPPRLRWPAADEKGQKYPSGTADSFPAVDADLLVQVSPLAFYNSPGPLNAYKRNVSVGIALYNGRTKQFIGRQTVAFSAPDSRFEYYKYDALVADLPAAAPALRQALLSLVPKVADIVSAKPVP